MRESIVESVKAFILPKFIKAQHFKHHGKRLYKERNSIYYVHLHLLRNELTKIQPIDRLFNNMA